MTGDEIFSRSDLVFSAEEVGAAYVRLAREITETLGEGNPLVLCVMKGAVVFAGQLLPLLRFPLDFDYVHATRYRNETVGGEIDWRVFPDTQMAGRQVLILDDILDEGHTLAAIRQRCLDAGATAFYSAVLLEKLLDKPKPVHADFIGLQVPDRYVFGCGMDVNGLWRNLPAIYALR
ncbi:hypoxanthine phosphoribosyltransferase [Novimethylophilus kurashikiensis]|uniref:Hypoxanthine phosphoribosyltransferase n=1 Tax=Novimethylophilus kurashikiensis TaxID=1825523 RepID=A0A2R5FFG3_9PROT|nr:hypoxanthine-guanine phosphoribosyltransferase [Novimethylophilus kurashikiensis]GBG15074.1 hypoxanthine phosphoribosyltransferase [Novimethylophilus kurashikiensis]